LIVTIIDGDPSVLDRLRRGVEEKPDRIVEGPDRILENSG
jgi:hypothetical protein